MRLPVRFLSTLIVLCASMDLTAGSSTLGEREAAIGFVETFFAAFDVRDLRAIEAAFVPSAKIVHDDGVITDVPTMLGIVKDTRSWAPRRRNLSQFEVDELGSGVVLVTCRNHVVFAPGTSAASEYTYSETWVLRPWRGRLRAVRSHYSRVTETEHSEEVDPKSS